LGDLRFLRKWIRECRIDRAKSLLPDKYQDFHKEKNANKSISVGVFSGSHNKKHLELITAFKTWFQRSARMELHLVGGTTPGLSIPDYLQRIQQEALDIRSRCT
jgi:hypothetical protein